MYVHLLTYCISWNYAETRLCISCLSITCLMEHIQRHQSSEYLATHSIAICVPNVTCRWLSRASLGYMTGILAYLVSSWFLSGVRSLSMVDDGLFLTFAAILQRVLCPLLIYKTAHFLKKSTILLLALKRSLIQEMVSIPRRRLHKRVCRRGCHAMHNRWGFMGMHNRWGFMGEPLEAADEVCDVLDQSRMGQRAFMDFPQKQVMVWLRIIPCIISEHV